ncbi:MAG TPA: hypothetical protein PLX89_23860 [Verrucomicrobiota bacterium]|nr:hypothetical protein [Verrucomicrobiales bacterium]HRI16045.1 hypothetical protein [Verrucomicrobiota bacterium]
MAKRTRLLIGGVIATVAAGVTLIWSSRQPKVVGQLPRDDFRNIRVLLRDNRQVRPPPTFTKAPTDWLADWIVSRRAGKLVRLEVQNANRVLAFVTTATPSQGRLLVIDRATNGWRISETNNSVMFR